MSNLSQDFLIQLKERISHLPASEVARVLSYYSEMIQDRMEDGVSEEVAILSLGKIDDIVATIEEEVPLSAIVKEKVQQQVEQKSKMSTERKLLIALLIIVTSPVWIGILGGVIGLVAGLWGAYIGVMAAYLGSTLLLGVGSLFSGVLNIVTFEFFKGLAYIGLGLLGIGGFILLLKPAIWLSVKWIEINIWPFKKLKRMLMK